MSSVRLLSLSGVAQFVLQAAGVAVAVSLGGCATAPVDAGPAPGHQRLHIETIHSLTSTTGFPLDRVTTTLEKLAGAKCTATNGKGSWETTTPGTVDVATGAGTLGIECAKDGFKPARVELSCTSPRVRASMEGAMMGLKLIAMAGPAAVVFAPAAVLAAMAGSTAAGAAIGSATAGPDADLCDYSDKGFIMVTLQREVRPRSP